MANSCSIFLTSNCRIPVLYLFLCTIFSLSFNSFGRVNASGSSKQVKLVVTPSVSNYKYSYLWRDASGGLHSTVFSLHRDDVKLGSQEFRKVGSDDDDEIVRKLQVTADKMGKKVNAEISVTQEDGQFSLDMKGVGVTPEFFQDVYDKLQHEQSNIIKDHLQKRFYDVELTGDTVMIRPDYSALVKRYRPIGQIVGRALRKSGPKDTRGLVEHALEFFQAIPYVRGANGGADFQTPVGLLVDNKGDCDTKAVALGSILDSWGIKYVFLLMPDHLFMGIELPKEKGDRSFNYGGRSYLLAEPAGIGFPLGVGYPDSVKAFSEGELEVIGF